MKTSYTTLSVQDKTLEQAVLFAKSWDLDGIELRGMGTVHISPEASFSYVKDAKRIIQDAGLSIPCMTAYTKFYQPSLSEVDKQVKDLRRMVELAEYMGASNVRTFMGALPKGMDKRRANEIAKTGLNKIADQIKNSPVNIVIETHDSVKDGKSMSLLLDGVSEKIGVLLDIIHPWDKNESIEETWRLIGKRIYHVHVKDIRETLPQGRIYCRIGEGVLSVEKTVMYLLSKEYDGFFSLEWEVSAEGYEGVTLSEQMESFIQLKTRTEGKRYENSI